MVKLGRATTAMKMPRCFEDTNQNSYAPVAAM
jgi:hypothetical protein